MTFLDFIIFLLDVILGHTTLTRGGKIGPAHWASPVHPELGPGWAIKLLAQKKPGQIWSGPIWPCLVWPDPARPALIFLPSKGYLARPALFLGRAGLLKFWPKKFEPILAWLGFGPAHCWPGPARPTRLPALPLTSPLLSSNHTFRLRLLHIRRSNFAFIWIRCLDFICITFASTRGQTFKLRLLHIRRSDFAFI